jgi:tetratricopeptide (TPR) repeat protein
VKASAYGLAALSIDAQDTDPQLAYALAERAYAFGQDDYTHSFIAITSHNLATFYAKKGNFEYGLGFENQAISIYEKIPTLLDSNLPPNSASEYYQNRAFFNFKLGFLEQATSDSLVACAKNHNRRNIQLLDSILLERGYRAEKCYVWTNKILVLTTNANGTENGMEHGFAYPDSIIKQTQNYH